MSIGKLLALLQAVAGNGGFAIGLLHPKVLTLFVSAVPLPSNVRRALQMMRLTRRVRAAEAATVLSIDEGTV